MTNKKKVMVLIGILLVCIGVGIFFAVRNTKSDVEKMVKRCWHEIGSEEISLDRIYVMRYSSRLELTGEVLETDMYQEIPSSGYAILFHSYGNPAFCDSYACFLDRDGELVFVFDYEENHLLYEVNYAQFSVSNIAAGERAVEYLTNCNYISGMINDASDEEYKGKMKQNTWYAFSDEQVEWVQK